MPIEERFLIAAFRANHHPLAEPSKTELTQLRKAIEAYEAERASSTPKRDEAVLTGWKLVPVAPTEAMVDAYWEQTGESKEMRARTHAYMRRYWSAMLASAPAPESGGVDAVRDAAEKIVFLVVNDDDHEHVRDKWRPEIEAAISIIASLSPAATPVSEAGVRTGAEMIARHRFHLADDGNCAEIDSGGLAEEIDAALASLSPAATPVSEAGRELA